MPYLSEKIPIAGTINDRRKKLDDYQKSCLKSDREMNGTSYNKLARAYGCSKRLAMLICNPEMAQRCKEQYKERRKDGRYYDRDKHTIQMKEHRDYKQGLHLAGVI